ncbi:hypothetical protein SDC9_20010 [bioreactor metagenome]|uniref:CRP-like cAMP-activated global transcriptional regulator n=1 Tax=bioreactor metagenome TaxID=1076179 RepID=A0A644U5I2_9ZZZZ
MNHDRIVMDDTMTFNAKFIKHEVKSMIENANFAKTLLSKEEESCILQFGTIMRYHRGQVIFSESDTADRIYYIKEGYVRIFRVTPYGKKVTVGSIRSPGQLMGLAETLYRGDRTCFASAINEVTLVVVRNPQFMDLLVKYPAIAIKASITLAIRMREAEQIIEEIACFQVSGRLAMFLVKMAKRMGVETPRGTKINFRLTHEEIAYMIGTTRQNVTSLLNVFKEENSIAIEDKELYILDFDKLNNWIV